MISRSSAEFPTDHRHHRLVEEETPLSTRARTHRLKKNPNTYTYHAPTPPICFPSAPRLSPVNKGSGRLVVAYRGCVSEQRRERQEPRQLHGRGCAGTASRWPPLPSLVGGGGSSGRGEDEGGEKGERNAVPAACRCCSRSVSVRRSNFRARRPPVRPCVLVLGRFNPEVGAAAAAAAGAAGPGHQ